MYQWFAPQNSNDQSVGAKPRKKASHTTVLRNCKEELSKFETESWNDQQCYESPKEGYRKVAEKFGIGRTQAQKILKEKEVILAE